MIKIHSNIKSYTLNIYDINNNLLQTFYINKFNQDIYNINYGGYFVEICYKSNLLLRKFIIYNEYNNKYCLNVLLSKKKIVLKLNDYYYDNLKIEKGNIFLWLIT